MQQSVTICSSNSDLNLTLTQPSDDTTINSHPNLNGLHL